MTQLAFELPRRESFGRADLFVSDSNAAALGWIDRWPGWPSPVLVLHGPTGAGKTHLAHLWCQRTGAGLVSGETLGEAHVALMLARSGANFAVDNADHGPEATLLHMFNACVEVGSSLLLTAREAPGGWRPALPDLGSRLRAIPAVGIGPPDDALLGAVLLKHFADRQLRVGRELIAYLVRHMERSFAGAAEIAAALDQAALRRQGAITIPLAKEFLAARAHQCASRDSDAGVT
jgi:chromosomal replication initiation ATPase DnaA